MANVALRLHPDCSADGLRSLRVADSEVTGPVSAEQYLEEVGPAGASAGAPVEAWRESWTFSVCGGSDEVPVLLGAYASGGVAIIFQPTPEQLQRK